MIKNSFGRERKHGFGTLAQVIERMAVPILGENIVSAATLVGADLIQFALPEIADVVKGEKHSTQLQTVWEDKL